MRLAGGLRWVVQSRSMTISNRKITNTQGESLLVENYARGHALFDQMRSAVLRHSGKSRPRTSPRPDWPSTAAGKRRCGNRRILRCMGIGCLRRTFPMPRGASRRFMRM